MKNIEDNTYKPEYNLLDDVFLGSKGMWIKKLEYLAKTAQEEQWDYNGDTGKRILYNYLCYTYDKIKLEGKIAYDENEKFMCFNTGLLTKHGADIYAYCIENLNFNKDSNDIKQKWFLYGFKTRSDSEMRQFSKFPDIADYFTEPSDFIYDKKKEIYIDYDHIIDDNYDRFIDVGLKEKYIIKALLEAAVKSITEKVKRNYKLAIPQYYTDKQTNEGKIQLLLPLFLQSRDKADLALVVDKQEHNYIGKTILTLEWAYINSRRIVRPDVEWLKI